MKTETAAPPAEKPSGNLTVADLGRALTKPAPAPTKTETETATEPVDESEDREPPAGDDAGVTQEQVDALSKTESTAETLTEEAEPETETPEATTEQQTETAASVSDAVRDRINEDLGPLIDELKKAGAKGAMQILQKRIPKLVDQRDTERHGRLAAEERLTQLQSELEEAQANPQENAPASNGAMHPAVAKVQRAVTEIAGFIKLFRDNPNGVEIPDGQGGTQNFTADEVSAHLDKLLDRRSELIAERKVLEGRVQQAYEHTYQQVREVAAKAYPWLKDPKAPEQQRLQQLLKVMPELKRSPDYELVVADYFRGKAAREAAEKTRAPGAPKPKPRTEPTRVVAEAPGTAGGPVSGKTAAEKKVKEAEAQFRKTGKKEDMQRLETAKRELARARS